jgi:hypothetical protein
MKQKICVIEVNEVPFRVWEKYIKEFPNSAVAKFFAEGKRYATLADDVEVDALYPSQTWASLNTGKPYSDHKIHWYNDPKPEAAPFWWQDVAHAGRSVGLVNVLHTSPLKNLTRDALYSFVVPDCFSPDGETLPPRFESFQRFNLNLTQKNGRSSGSGMSDLLGLATQSLTKPKSFGVSGFTVWQVLRALPDLFRSKERLRNLQFPPLASIFLQLIRQNDPDVAVMFTNHIAATQHRYWYALFPDDYVEKLYSDQWVEKYRNDVMNAVSLFDAYLSQLMTFCQRSNRILVLVSSMGQCANQKLTRDRIAAATWDYRLEAPLGLMSAVLGKNVAVKFEGAMIPQYTYSFNDPQSAKTASEQLLAWVAENDSLFGVADVNGTKLTLTIKVTQRVRTLQINNSSVPLGDFGFIELEIDDHHSGRHHPEGVLAIWNDKRDSLFPSASTPPSFSYLKYAPEMLRHCAAKQAALAA